MNIEEELKVEFDGIVKELVDQAARAAAEGAKASISDLDRLNDRIEKGFESSIQKLATSIESYTESMARNMSSLQSAVNGSMQELRTNIDTTATKLNISREGVDQLANLLTIFEENVNERDDKHTALLEQLNLIAVTNRENQGKIIEFGSKSDRIFSWVKTSYEKLSELDKIAEICDLLNQNAAILYRSNARLDFIDGRLVEIDKMSHLPLHLEWYFDKKVKMIFWSLVASLFLNMVVIFVLVASK